MGDKQQEKKLQWILAEYEHAKDAFSSFHELGQIFCHHAVMQLYAYTGIDDIKFISNFDESIWNYLEVRNKATLFEFIERGLVKHIEEHRVIKKISDKWNRPIDELSHNSNDLAIYVIEGIIQVIK